MGEPSRQFDCILLDLDGTISDPAVGIGRSLNFALACFGFAEIQTSTVAHHIGPPLDEAFKAITGDTSPPLIEALVAKYRERYAEIGYSENALYPGIRETLPRLTAAGIPLGVCTSKRADFAERILDMFELRHHFQFVSGGDVGIQKWQQIEELVADGSASTSSVMVGDRAVDMTAAHRNGLQAAGVLWGYGSHEELAGERPAYVLEKPGDLHTLAD